MTTSLDTNTLIALWDTSSGMTAAVSKACQHFRKSGPIVICGPVFGELLGLPKRTSGEIHRLLEDEQISIEWEFSQQDWQTRVRHIRDMSCAADPAEVGFPAA
jgi:hypothetical protein